MANIFDKLKYFFNTENIVKRSSKSGKIVYKKIHKQPGKNSLSSTNSMGGFFTGHGSMEQNKNFFGTADGKTDTASRMARYEEYNAMDLDSLVAGVLDIYSEDATTLNTAGETISIISENGKIKNILTNLFYDILKVEFHLADWIRQTLKYGDFFIKLEIDDEYGIVGFEPILPHMIEIRMEIVADQKGQSLRPVYYLSEIGQNRHVLWKHDLNRKPFENYELIHFRYKQDELYYPFSKSLLESGRRTWAEIKLMEDAMLVYNITRAPSKRGFFINVGNLPPKDVDAFMEKIVESVKRDKIIDEDGKVNLRYNIENILDDYFIPTRGSNDSSRIETIDGGGDYNIEPLDYLKDKMLSSWKVPKAYLGYEEDLSGKSNLAGEDIRFARTIRNVQKLILDQLSKIAMIHLYVQGFDMGELLDFELELTNPSSIHEKQQLEMMTEKLNITQSAMESNIVSTNWIYENVWKMTEYEMKEMKKQIAKDKQFHWKLQGIEDSGEIPDPGETAQSDWGNAGGEEGNDGEEEQEQFSGGQGTFNAPTGNEDAPDSKSFEGNNPTLSFESALKKKMKTKMRKDKKERIFDMLQKDIQQDLRRIFDSLQSSEYGNKKMLS